MVNRSTKWPCSLQRHVLPFRITRPSMFARPLHLMLSKPRSIRTWDYHHIQGMYAKSVVWPGIDAVQDGMKPARQSEHYWGIQVPEVQLSSAPWILTPPPISIGFWALNVKDGQINRQSYRIWNLTMVLLADELYFSIWSTFLASTGKNNPFISFWK